MILKRKHETIPARGLRARAVLLMALLPFSAQAANLSDIYKLAVGNDPQLRAAEARFLSRSEVVKQSRAGLLPTFSILGVTADNSRIFLSSSYPKDNYNDHRWQAVLRQPIFRLENWFRFQQSRNIKAEAVATFAAEQQSLMVRVAESYFTILERESFLSASKAERDAVQRQLEQVRQRFDVGLVAITDVLESRAAYDSSTVNVIEAEGAQSTSFEPLLRLTGQPMGQVHGLDRDFPVRHPEPEDEDEWVRIALETNYEIIAAKERVKSAQHQMQMAKSNHYPVIDAEVSYMHSVSGGLSFLGNKMDQRAMTLSMTLPIYQGGAVRSAIRQAGYDLEAAQQALDLEQRRIVEATRNLYSAVNTDVARVRARLRGIESSESALDATRTGYEVGTRNIVDVLQAQQRLYLSRFQYASARYRYVLDTLRLKQAVGILNPDDLYDLNRFIDSSIIVDRTSAHTR